MGQCKDCIHWSEISKDENTDMYTDDFGNCSCEKFAYYEDLYENYRLDKEKLKNYHVLYEDSEGYFAELKVHKQFGCINFKDRNTYQK